MTKVSRWILSALAITCVGMALRAPAEATKPVSKPVNVGRYTHAIKVACVGDSITCGAWPSDLGAMLGAKWEVKGLGVSGKTLMNGRQAYRGTPAFKEALAFLPDVVLIMLGTNDTKPANWAAKQNFEPDYKDMIKQFKDLNTKPIIYICYPPFVPGEGKYGINEAGVLEQIPIIEKVAKETGVYVIDVHGALKGKDSLFPDRVHPNAEGQTVIAKTMYQALTGKPAPATVPPIPGAKPKAAKGKEARKAQK